MRLRGQRGQTLIELMIGIAITGLVLAALGGLLYTVSDRFAGWGKRLDTAMDGFGVASALQADSHRYVVCGSVNGPQLSLCLPTAGCIPKVMYQGTENDGNWVITRTEDAKTTLVTRANAAPTFVVDLVQTPGTIKVNGIDPSLSVIVYYHAPVRRC